MVNDVKDEDTIDMPFATRLSCGLLDCNLGQGDESGGRYKTPPHLTKIEETQKDMEQHLLVHSLMKNDGGTKNRPKVEAISRPSLQEGSSEGAYKFFHYEWKHYKETSNMWDQETVKQLIHCVNSDIRRKVFESTMGALDSEDNILKHLKQLCVKSQNRLVNIVEFGELVQGREEPVAVNLARLKGAAANCGFKLRCTKEGCGHEIDYSRNYHFSVDQRVIRCWNPGRNSS